MTNHQCLRELLAKIVKRLYDADHGSSVRRLMNKVMRRWEYSIGNEGDLVIVKFDPHELRKSIWLVRELQEHDYTHVHRVNLDGCGGENPEYHIAVIKRKFDDGVIEGCLRCLSHRNEDINEKSFIMHAVCGYDFLLGLLKADADVQKLSDLCLADRLSD